MTWQPSAVNATLTALAGELAGGTLSLYEGVPGAGGVQLASVTLPDPLPAPVDGVIEVDLGRSPGSPGTPSHLQLTGGTATLVQALGTTATASPIVSGDEVVWGVVALRVPSDPAAQAITVTWSEGATEAEIAASLIGANSGAVYARVHHGSRIAWSHTGGDWVDAAGVGQGSVAYGTVPSPSSADQWVETGNIAALWNDWHSGVRDYHGIIGVTPEGAGTIVWASRENANGNGPVFVVDGVNYPAVEDTYILPDTVTSRGRQDRLESSGTRRVLLRPPVEALGPAADVRLRMYATEVYSGRQPIGIYACHPRHDIIVPQPTMGIAAAYPLDVGIEAHASVAKHETFQDNTWALPLADWLAAGDLASGKWVRASDDPHIPDRPDRESGWIVEQPGRLTVRFVDTPDPNIGSEYGRGGGNIFWPFFRSYGSTYGNPEAPRTVHLRYYVCFGDGTMSPYEGGVFFTREVGGKIPGIGGLHKDDFGQLDGHPYGIPGAGGGSSGGNGDNGWDCRGQWSAPVDDAANPMHRGVGIGYYCSDADRFTDPRWANTYTRYDEAVNLATGTYLSGLCIPGRWVCYEMRLINNSAPDVQDGQVDVWINGRLDLTLDNIRFWTVNTYGPLGITIDRIWWNPYFGGQSIVPEYPMCQFYSDVVIATEYIGPRVNAQGQMIDPDGNPLEV